MRFKRDEMGALLLCQDTDGEWLFAVPLTQTEAYLYWIYQDDYGNKPWVFDCGERVVEMDFVEIMLFIGMYTDLVLHST